jgi:hypothetical protein
MNELKEKTFPTVGFLYLIWPLMVLVGSIRNYRESWAKNGIWLFVIFFGFTFVPREGMDSMGMAQRLYEFHTSDIGLGEIFRMIYVPGSRYLDVIQILLTYLVSTFTSDTRILFALFGTIFGYFYSRNIWALITATEGKLGRVEVLLLILFSMIIPIWFINGMRFWSAAHIFIFGALQFLLYNKRQGFLISAFAILMHFSFVLPVAILGAYMVAGNRTRVYFGFFIVSLIVSSLDPMFVRETLLGFVPAIFHDRVTSYTSLDRIEYVRAAYAGANFYARWYGPAIKIGVSSLLILIFLSGRENWKQQKVINLYSFALLFYGVANLVYTVMGRFTSVANMISVAAIFMYFYYLSQTHPSRRLFYLAFPFLLFFTLVIFRLGLDNTSVYVFISNPVFAPFLESTTALIDLIR